MTADQILAKARQLGVALWVDGGRIRYQASAGIVDAALLEAIRGQKQALIALLARDAAMPRADRSAPLRLSFAQERLWLLHQLEPASVAYHMPAALRLDGPLDAPALERALAEIVHRHEALRTTFEIDAAGQPVQRIHATGNVTLARRSLREVPPAERDAQVERAIRDEGRAPFDLLRGPLVRAQLLELGDDAHVLLFTMHHIVSDGWSIGVLVREVMALYEAFVAGRPSPLPPLEVQYADYAVWQRSWLSGAELEAQTTYWTGHLAGAPMVLELPVDRPRPATQTFRGATVERPLGRELTAQVDALSKELGATPFMVLFAAFNVVLGRYANARDLVVGTPIANRTRVETEPLIGLFMNTLAIRTDLSGDPTFAELVARVKEATLGAYAHQDLPFEKVVEALQVPRDLSRSPVFQVLFALQNAPVPALSLAGLTARRLDRESGTAKFDLFLEIAPTAAGYITRWELNADLFERATIERLAGHFEHVLRGVLARPAARVGSAPLLSDGERRAIVHGFNATARPFRPVPVHTLFEEAAARWPDVLAVVFGDQALSYAALHRRSNELARHLQRLGVVPHSLVGMCLERSLDVPVAVLGILKAGAACVPMDASYPTERLRFMAEDARAPVIVTQTPLVARISGTGGSGGSSSQIVCMDTLPFGTLSAADLAPEVGADALCYVIYTSGSTGVPKGAALPHEMLTNLVQWQLTESSLGVGARTLQFSPLSFDVCYDELFSTWAAGGTLVLVSEDTRRDPVQLLALIARDRVERVFIPFVALHGIADAARAMGPPPLREIVCGGEQLQITPEVVELFQQIPGCLLHNQYGPTESHFVTGYRLTGDSRAWPKLPPIGAPIFNNQMYVLDGAFEPVPIGVAGDLYIAGQNLARCYWRRGGMTAERFVPNPFSATPGARMYRTGDIARYLPDGNIEYLGRSDHQVKIRGFRIELAEIEQALMGLSAVGSAAAVVREVRPGVKQLIGYVVPRPGVVVEPRALRDELKDRLPEYMVPSAFVVLDKLPLTPSGKVDRRSLPEPDGTEGDAYVAPRTPREAQLADIWRDVLRVERVGATDNFFELGGHSLLATQVVSRIRTQLQAEIALRVLFEAPTVEELALRLEDEARPGGPPIVAGAAGAGPSPASFAQERLWFLGELDPGSAAYNIAAAIRLEGRLDVDALARSVAEVVRRHAALRTTFAQDRQGQVIAVVHAEPLGGMAGGMVIEELRGADDARLFAEAEREAMAPFVLRQGPLFRARLLEVSPEVSPEVHVALFTMHHIVSDGWSIGVLVREVMALYDAFAHGRPSPLPPLEIQYADYAAWQRSWLSGAELEAQTAYWKQQLAGAPAVFELPTDRPRPAMQTFRGAVVERALGTAVTAQVDVLGQELGATPFMVLLAAFNVVLGRYGNARDLVVGTPIANRTRAEIEPLIGLFVNTLAVRTDLSGDPTFAELVERVKDATLGAYAHQDLPFEKVVEALRAPRDLSRSPVFQVLFALQNAPVPALSLEGLSARVLEVPSTIAKFDLSLYVTRRADEYVTSWELNTDLFDRETIERMAMHFEALVRQATAVPVATTAAISTLALLDPGEQRRLLVDWNATEAPREANACLHELVEAQVRRTPEATAIVFGDEAVTYRALDARADRVAMRLRALGVGPDDCVAVCMLRSIDMVAALLGTLKAGGAYVPMDPGYPHERLAYMLADAGCRVLLTTDQLAKLLPAGGAAVIALDAEPPNGPEDKPADGPGDKSTAPTARAAVRPAHCAYVIYTSGSTGRPKGVQVTHEAVVNFLAAMARTPGLDASDTLLAVTSISFDIATLEIFLPLVRGAKLVLADAETAADGARLVALARASHTSIVQATPSTFWLMLEAGWPETLRCKVLCGGEALPAALSQALRGRATSLWNMYGPTETTIWSTVCRVEADTAAVGEARSQGVGSIGRPIENTVVRVLDDHGRLCPVGVPGELCIGGVGVARGYLRRPALTAERFVPDPYADRPGARLYRTGDLARWLPSGELAFLGRIDHQVKVRGFRIELGEIEAVLAAHDQVSQAVVIVREDAPGDKRIVAYLVSRSAEPPAPAELRRHVGRSLPDYMVPSAFVVLERLPLTPNGKLDRKALPAPTTAGAARPYVPPATPAERAVVQIWQDVLRVERVGLDDSFFELGGHSLLATQLLGRLRAELGAKLSLKDIFEAQTPAGLIARAEAPGSPPGSSPGSSTGSAPGSSTDSAPESAPANLVLLRAGTSRPLFLVHAVGGGVSPYLALTRDLADGQAVFAFQAPGLDGVEPPVETIEALAARYIADLSAVQPDGPLWLGGWSMGGVVAFEMARQLGSRAQTLVLIDPPPPPSPGGLAPHEAWTWPVGEYLADLARSSGTPLPFTPLELEQLIMDPERDAIAIRAARSHNLIPPTLSDEVLRARIAVFAANQRAVRRYVPREPVGADLILLLCDGTAPSWTPWVRGAVTQETVSAETDHWSIVRVAGQYLRRLL